MLLASQLHSGRTLVTRTLFLSSCSFHSALKRQLKADKKAQEKEAKLLSADGGEGNKVGLQWLI